MGNTNYPNHLLTKFKELETKRIEDLTAIANQEWQKELLRDGIVIRKGILNTQLLEQICEFLDTFEAGFDNFDYHSGYLIPRYKLPKYKRYFYQMMGKIKDLGHNQYYFYKAFPNTGQVRLGSKVFPEIINFPHMRAISKINVFKEAFNFYYRKFPEDLRYTHEWVYPAKINHNGWHQDTISSQLKCIILLSDINEKTAPMVYAEKSHMLNSCYKKNHINYFLNNYDKPNDNSRFTNPSNSSHFVEYSNAGYIPDAHIVSENSTTLMLKDGSEKTNFSVKKCYGKAGDVIIFESSGFHRGTISLQNVRRTITIGSLDINTPGKKLLIKNKVGI